MKQITNQYDLVGAQICPLASYCIWSITNTRWSFANTRWSFTNTRWSFANTPWSFANTCWSFANTRWSFANIRRWSFANTCWPFISIHSCWTFVVLSSLCLSGILNTCVILHSHRLVLIYVFQGMRAFIVLSCPLFSSKCIVFLRDVDGEQI